MYRLSNNNIGGQPKNRWRAPFILPVCSHTAEWEYTLAGWLDGCAASQFVWLPNIFMCLLLENNIIYKRRVHRSLDEWIDPGSSQWKLICKRDVRDGPNMLVGENLLKTPRGLEFPGLELGASLGDICFLMISSPAILGAMGTIEVEIFILYMHIRVWLKRSTGFVHVFGRFFSLRADFLHVPATMTTLFEK
jgi:hypothetical protein